MIIDERIFNELEEINLDTIEGRDVLYEFADESWANLSKTEKKEFCNDNDVNYDENGLTENEMPDEYWEMILEETIFFYKIPEDSLLEQAIFTYGQTKGYGNLFDTFDKLGLTMMDNEAYFTAGCGYSIIDVDLLNGDGSGNTKREFLKIINENN